ncbi:MAG: lamin tail domain-containing protein [Patescibacteria group bacterium]
MISLRFIFGRVFFFLSLFVFSFHVAYANILINEVMYDVEGTDTDREWIEVYNDGSESVDLSTYKLFEANTNHGLTLSSGDKNIPAGGYVIIVSDYSKFKIDWPSLSVSIFDSTFSLNNEGENLAIKDNSLNISNEYMYVASLGAGGDGKSLQKINNIWSASIPTPGVVNSATNSNSVPENTLTNTAENTNTSSSVSVGSTSRSKISTKINRENLIFVGIPSIFNAETTGYDGQKLMYGKYIFNFGDGGSEELQANSYVGLNHTYYYPGEYVVTVEYYNSNYLKPETVSQINIEVINTPIIISKIGDEKDFFIELTNMSSYDIDISNWILLYDTQKFLFPKNSFILGNKKIILSSKITKFTFNTSQNIVLQNVLSDVIFSYGESSQKSINIIQKKAKFTSFAKEPTLSLSNLNDTNKYLNFDADLSSEDLSARAIGSNTLIKDKNNVYTFLFSFILFVGLASVAVYYLRMSKRKKQLGDDFDILDE